MAPEMRIGTSGWHYKSWHGPFYPLDVKIKDFLSYYVTQFDTAEINNSFYRLPTEKAVKAWRDGVPDGFVFAWKVSRYITHMKRLKDIEDSITLVFGRMAVSTGPLVQCCSSFRRPSRPMPRRGSEWLDALISFRAGTATLSNFAIRAGMMAPPSTCCGIATWRSASPIMPMRRPLGK